MDGSHIHITSNAAIAVLLGVVLFAASHPIELPDSLEGTCSASPHGLLSRAPVAFPAPPGFKPPVPKKPDGPINKLNPGGPSFKGNPIYREPASYSTYTDKGRVLQQQFNDRPATAPDISHNYATKISNYQNFRPQTAASNIVGGELAILTAVSFRNALGRPPIWQKYAIKGGGPTDVLVVYHSPQQRSIVISELFKQRYGISTDKQVPFSELIFQSWSRKAGADLVRLKYITIADINPPEFLNVMKDARKLKDSEKDDAGGVISFDSNSIIQADKDAFAALAGMDNTRNVFNMLSDHKMTFQGRGVTEIHTFAEGSGGGSAHHVTFELAD